MICRFSIIFFFCINFLKLFYSSIGTLLYSSSQFIFLICVSLIKFSGLPFDIIMFKIFLFVVRAIFSFLSALLYPLCTVVVFLLYSSPVYHIFNFAFFPSLIGVFVKLSSTFSSSWTDHVHLSKQMRIRRDKK